MAVKKRESREKTPSGREKTLDHGWPESRTSQARSAQRCRMRSFSLHEAFVKQARDSTRQGALRKLVGASWSAQVALRKLHCASCSAQVAPRKLCNLLCASCSAQVALKCKLHLATPARGPGRNRTRDPPVPGAGARTTRQLPRTSSNNKSRKSSSFRPRRFPQRVARAPQKSQKKPWFCTSTTPIPAEGCASTAEIAKNQSFLHLDHADPRRGSREHRRNLKKTLVLHLDHTDPRRGLREHRRNRKKPFVFAPRPRRSPQRVRRACWKSQKKTMGFCTSTTPIPAEGRASTAEIAKKPWVFAPRPRRSPQRVAREL